MTKWIGVLAASLLVTFVADEASAKKRRKVQTETTTDGYRYDFTDDPLTAVNNGAHTAQIRVRKAGVRRMLLRPRASFVPELLKSVEAL